MKPVTEMTMEDLQEQLKNQPAYVDNGGSVQLLVASGVAVINGKFALTYTLGAKTDRNGAQIEVKKRGPRKPSTEAPSANKRR